MTGEMFGRLHTDYIVEFARLLLLRDAPLHTMTEGDERLVSAFATGCMLTPSMYPSSKGGGQTSGR
jgi:hypothetical protein